MGGEMKSDDEVRERLAMYGWELIRRDGLKADVRCKFCGAEKHAGWSWVKEYCHCTDNMNTAMAVPLVTHDFYCMKCETDLVICDECKKLNLIGCGVCNRKKYATFPIDEGKQGCIHVYDREKMSSPTR